MAEPVIDDLQALFRGQTPLLDVRAPVEFERGSFPGAHNLPLLDNDQREAVGKRYKEAGQSEAIALGESIATPAFRERCIENWRAYLENNEGAALYCFRGGLRSQISQQWLSDAGIEVSRVSGGYKRMRQFLIDEIATSTAELPWIVLGGRTGTGKTRLLTRLPRTIDLEGLAKHRGSSFGKLACAQPSNIDFENSLAVEMLRLRTAPETNSENTINRKTVPVFIEDEAKLIGRVALPDVLRDSMAVFPLVFLEEPIEQRLAVTRADYVDDLLVTYQKSLGEEAGLDALFAHHRDSLMRIKKRLGGAATTEVSGLLEDAIATHLRDSSTDGYLPFLEYLLVRYYDPMYDYQLARKNRPVVFSGNAEAIYEWATDPSLDVQSLRAQKLQPV